MTLAVAEALNPNKPNLESIHVYYLLSLLYLVGPGG